MSKLPVYILAGGKSSRFGADKARAEFHGKPLIQHVAEALHPFATSIIVVADQPDKYDDLQLFTLADEQANLGPLGGLQTALADCLHPQLLLTSCDFVNLNPAWVFALLEHAHDPYDAVAFKSDRWQPLFALYHQSIEPLVLQHIESDNRSMQALLTAAHSCALPLPPDWPTRPGVNTQQELDDLR